MSQAWSHLSQSDDWPFESSADTSDLAHGSGGQWSAGDVPKSHPDFPGLNTAAREDPFHGPVDFSPVLSLTSESAQTLNSPGPEVCSASIYMDPLFSLEPDVPTSTSVRWLEPGLCYPSLPGQEMVNAGIPYGDSSAYATVLQRGCPPRVFNGTDLMLGPRNDESGILAFTGQPAASKRQLLPRVEGPQPMLTGAQKPRVLRPLIEGRCSPTPYTVEAGAASQPQDAPRYIHVGQPENYVNTSGSVAISQPMVVGGNGPALPPTPASQELNISSPRPDPAAEEFSAFVQFDQDEPGGPAMGRDLPVGRVLQHPGHRIRCTSNGSGYPARPSEYSGVAFRGCESPVLPKPNRDSGGSQPTSRNAAPVARESEEGRNRTHAFYRRGPSADDGLYHCPFESDLNCTHQPTKLKCNHEYETIVLLFPKTVSLTVPRVHSKYIDSHVKPFRCKNPACVNQAFSSTACLLRHEREAHGLHGHGERPHLCQYVGCDRAVEGKGFPRRYNLYDHMKRVHDHKEDPQAGTRNPASTEGSTVTERRKRKSVVTPPFEPGAQRQKSSAYPGAAILTGRLVGATSHSGESMDRPLDSTWPHRTVRNGVEGSTSGGHPPLHRVQPPRLEPRPRGENRPDQMQPSDRVRSSDGVYQNP